MAARKKRDEAEERRTRQRVASTEHRGAMFSRRPRALAGHDSTRETQEAPRGEARRGAVRGGGGEPARLQVMLFNRRARSRPKAGQSQQAPPCGSARTCARHRSCPSRSTCSTRHLDHHALTPTRHKAGLAHPQPLAAPAPPPAPPPPPRAARAPCTRTRRSWRTASALMSGWQGRWDIEGGETRTV